MSERICLLRGVNVGGVKVPMNDLKAIAVEAGFAHPRTLLASGNLVVESTKATAALETDIEAAMQATFGLKIAAMARTPQQWADLIAANPFKAEAQAQPARALAMVMKDAIRPGVVEACRELAAPGERVEAVDGTLYFWFPNGQGQSAIFKKATPRMLGMGTGRNWNTVLKLGEMAGIETA